MRALFRPIVVAFLAFLAGLLLGLRSGAPVIACILSALVLAGLALMCRRGAATGEWGTALVLLALGVAGAAAGSRARSDAQADCRTQLPDGAKLVVAGVLGSGSQAAEDPQRSGAPLLPLNAQRVHFRGKEVAGCRPELRVRLPDGASGLRAGAELQLEGVWLRSQPPVVKSAWPSDPRLAGMLLPRAKFCRRVTR